MTAPLPAEVGEIAPLKAKAPPGAAMSPSWIGTGEPAVSSYQRTTEGSPGVAETVCCVQTAISCRVGSSAATAWVRRVSELSIPSVVPGWGTGAGSEKPDTGNVD